MSEWTVTDSNGTTHSISCAVKAFKGPVITVDGNDYRVKSSNAFVNVVDYVVDFPGANCHVVMVGKSIRLAVNGTYQEDGTAYEPVANVPAWIWVLVAVSAIGGWFFGGILCCVIGIAFSNLYILGSLEKNNKKVFGSFIIFLAIVAVWFGLQLALLA